MKALPGTGRRDGGFGRFVAASGCANLADGIALVAWSWTASLLTRDPLLIAAVAAMLRLPWALAAIPAGILTDRLDRRRLILGMDLTRAGVFAATAALLWATLPLPEPPAQGTAAPLAYAGLLAAAAAVGLAEVFRDNAAQTLLPSIVPHARLERANGRLWSVELTANALAGPALGAWLLALAVPAPFAANALAYFAGFALMRGLRGGFRPEQTQVRDWRRELAEAFAFLRGRRCWRRWPGSPGSGTCSSRWRASPWSCTCRKISGWGRGPSA
jgi:MFS family permease